jgi:hypothetical protein
MLIIYKVFFSLFFLFFQIFTFGPFHRVVLEVGYQEILANLFSIFSYQSCKHFFVLFSYYLYFFFCKSWVYRSLQSLGSYYFMCILYNHFHTFLFSPTYPYPPLFKIQTLLPPSHLKI